MEKLSNKNIINWLHNLFEFIGYYIGYYIAMIINYKNS